MKFKYNYFCIKISFLFFLLYILLLSSCSNFLNGSDFKNQLKEDIDYANSQNYDIYVVADEGTGIITTGSGKQSVKPTDSFDVEFQPDSAYKFIKWISVDKTDQNKSRENYISFSTPDLQSTQVTLLYACKDIAIKPYCLPYLTVNTFLPENKDNGVSFNSPIEITFSNYIDENAFSYTEEEIKNLGLSENELLESQTFDGKRFVYGYQKNGRIFYKNIEIISSDGSGSITHYFKPPKIIEGKTLYLELDSENYSIISSGLADGVTKAITITLSNSIKDINGMGFVNDYTNLSFKYTINNKIISTTPCEVVTFYADENSGSIMPSGENVIYTDLSYSLSFAADESYYFERWGVFYKANQQEFPYANQIVQIEDVKSKNTKFTLSMAVPGLMVMPICKERPVIYLTSPDSDNSSPTSDITVTFSHSMNLEDLRWLYSDITDEPVQRELRDSNEEIYGYITHTNEHIWKNIQITSSTGDNLLPHFEYPEYELNGTKLVIKARSENPITSGTIVFVRINKAIRDTDGIPFGEEGDYIIFNYQVK